MLQRRPTRTLSTLLALTASCVLLAACGGGSDDSSGSGDDGVSTAKDEPVTLATLVDDEDARTEDRIADADGEALLLDVLEQFAKQRRFELVRQDFQMAPAAAAAELAKDNDGPPVKDEDRLAVGYDFDTKVFALRSSQDLVGESQRRCVDGISYTNLTDVGEERSAENANDTWRKGTTDSRCTPQDTDGLTDGLTVGGLDDDQAATFVQGLEELRDDAITVEEPVLRTVDGRDYLELDVTVATPTPEDLQAGPGPVMTALLTGPIDPRSIPWRSPLRIGDGFREVLLVDLETGLPAAADQLGDGEEATTTFGPRARFQWSYPDTIDPTSLDDFDGVKPPAFPTLIDDSIPAD